VNVQVGVSTIKQQSIAASASALGVPHPRNTRGSVCYACLARCVSWRALLARMVLPLPPPVTDVPAYDNSGLTAKHRAYKWLELISNYMPILSTNKCCSQGRTSIAAGVLYELVHGKLLWQSTAFLGMAHQEMKHQHVLLDGEKNACSSCWQLANLLAM